MAFEPQEQLAGEDSGAAPEVAEAQHDELGPEVTSEIMTAAASGPEALGPILARLPDNLQDPSLALVHRTHGNAFVSRALSGRAQVQMRGEGGGDGVHGLAVAGTTGGGSELPHREAIQQSFGAGHDLSGVQAHVGGAAAQASAAMGAEAYAVGNHVAFREQPSLHLAAHEATHIVQQQQGVQLSGGVGEVGDPYEQQADAVADAVVGGQRAEGLLAQPPSGGGGEAVQLHALDVSGADLATVSSRAGAETVALTTDTNRATGEKETGLAVTDGKSMAKNPAFEAKAQAFEDWFAQKVWNDGRTKATTQQMATAAKTYLVAKHGEWKKTNDKLMGVVASLGSDNPAWSGSVGKTEAHFQALLDVFDKGNVAEQMAHLEAFYIEVMGPAALDTDTAAVDALIDEAKMDAEYFEARKRNAVKGKSKYAMIDVPAGSDVEGQWHARMKRYQKDDETTRKQGERSERTIEETGAELSEREEALHKEKDASFDKSTDPVMWEEGVRIWIMNEQDKWCFAQREASLPIGAGPSGTTNKCMQIAKLLGVSDPYLGRLAAIGYLLPAKHHTLVEILAGAEPHGCPFPRGQQMYRGLRPYEETDLATCGEDGKFPDEVAGDHLTATS